MALAAKVPRPSAPYCPPRLKSYSSSHPALFSPSVCSIVSIVLVQSVPALSKVNPPSIIARVLLFLSLEEETKTRQSAETDPRCRITSLVREPPVVVLAVVKAVGFGFCVCAQHRFDSTY